MSGSSLFASLPSHYLSCQAHFDANNVKSMGVYRRAVCFKALDRQLHQLTEHRRSGLLGWAGQGRAGQGSWC